MENSFGLRLHSLGNPRRACSGAPHRGPTATCWASVSDRPAGPATIWKALVLPLPLQLPRPLPLPLPLQVQLRLLSLLLRLLMLLRLLLRLLLLYDVWQRGNIPVGWWS